MSKIKVVEVNEDAILLLQGAMYGDEFIDLSVAKVFHTNISEALEHTDITVMYIPKEIDVSVLNIKK